MGGRGSNPNPNPNPNPITLTLTLILTLTLTRWEAAGPEERREMAALWQFGSALDTEAQVRWRGLSHVQQLSLLQVSRAAEMLTSTP